MSFVVGFWQGKVLKDLTGLHLWLLAWSQDEISDKASCAHTGCGLYFLSLDVSETDTERRRVAEKDQQRTATSL